jgi:hypothetical protein
MAENETTKVFAASSNAKAGIELSEDSAALVGDSRHFVIADDRGTTIKGPVSIVADAMSIRRGGLFVGLNDFLHMIPSTIISPIPNQIPMPPMHGIINLQKDLTFFLACLI